MSNVQHDAADGSIDTDLAPTAIFDLLSNDRRQLALLYLTRSVGAVSLGDLADQLALWEGEHTRERYERICTSLVHVHLPKLTEYGVVRYDTVAETIDLRETADQMIPYLELAGSHERR